MNIIIKKRKKKKNENIPDKILVENIGVRWALLYTVKGSLVQLSKVLSHLDFTCTIKLVGCSEFRGGRMSVWYPWGSLAWHALWSCRRNDGTLARPSLSCNWSGTFFLALGFNATCLAILKVKNQTFLPLNVGIKFYSYFDLFLFYVFYCRLIKFYNGRKHFLACLINMLMVCLEVFCVVLILLILHMYIICV